MTPNQQQSVEQDDWEIDTVRFSLLHSRFLSLIGFLGNSKR